jgi:hypothetical protein
VKKLKIVIIYRKLLFGCAAKARIAVPFYLFKHREGVLSINHDSNDLKDRLKLAGCLLERVEGANSAENQPDLSADQSGDH